VEMVSECPSNSKINPSHKFRGDGGQMRAIEGRRKDPGETPLVRVVFVHPSAPL
jgi:hypothetical protein